MPHIHKIFGPPGTGKTTRLIQIVRDCMKEGITLPEIGYLAHTRAAANEAYDRVRDFAGTHRPPYFCTIHAAARRVVGVNPRNIWGYQEWHALAQRTGMRFNVGAEWNDDNTSDVNGDPVIQCINFAKSRMISTTEAMKQFERYEVVSPFSINMVEQAMEEIKIKHEKLDFDDILQKYHELPQPLHIRVMLVDEAQDLSVFQWQIVREMWKNCERVVLCGDDDQSIYAFLGADPDGFLQHPCDTSEVLPVSWRVPRAVGRVAEKIIAPVQKRQKKTLTWRDVEGSVRTVYADKNALPITPGEKTLVLVRHNIQGRAVYKAIRESGMPVAYNGESYLLDNEAKALAIYHRLREGCDCAFREGLQMLKEMPTKGASVKRMEEIKGESKNATRRLTKDDFDIQFVSNPVSMFGATMQSAKIFSLLCWNVQTHGPGVLLKLPDVQVMTIHASKGREADHVILMTDCYPSVWEAQSNTEADTERKVAYVAVTRTRQRLSVVFPKTDMYLRAVMEAI